MNAPRPEYPRPQFVRDRWLSLNGAWEFAFDDAGFGLKDNWHDGRAFERRINVPFAYQTEASGINDKGIHETVWYARDFSIPDEWNGQDVLLNFGAVDYRSSVWINGREVGHNQGGHVPFSFEITPYLRPGSNRLTVRVEDSQDPHQPRGKQSSEGIAREIDYYCTTGIWQSVWLEPVPSMRIEELRITPVFDENAFAITTYLHAPSSGWEINVKISAEGTEVANIQKSSRGAVTRAFVQLDNPRPWSPEDPFLYDLEITLCKQGESLDTVRSYAGLRSVSIEGNRFLLNGRSAFLAMVLDQGYWPASGMTAATDEELRADVEWIKRFGYNGVRKHQKIEDPRWLYWCDRLGLLVWGEMANARDWTPKAEEWLMAEWERAVRRDYNHPCIVAWVPMNESWGVPGLRENHPGQFAYLERIVSTTRRVDRYRPVIDNDGWEHTDITDILAIHDYTPTAEGLRERYAEAIAGGDLPDHMWLGNIPLFSRGSQYRGQPVILTEVGGFLMIPPQIPPGERDVLYQFYGSVNTALEMYDKYADLMDGLGSLPFISGFCYTQLTDVEQEINGILTYDRQPKIEPHRLSELHERLIAKFSQ